MPRTHSNNTVQFGGNRNAVAVTPYGTGVTSGIVQTTRPNDTNAYLAGDVVGGLITFPNFDVGELLITSVNFYRGSSALASGEGSYTLHLYSFSPASPIADNAAWDLVSGDRAIYLGAIDLGAPSDLGGTVRVDVDGINKQVTCTGDSLYGYLVTGAAYTPSAQSITFLNIHAVLV